MLWPECTTKLGIPSDEHAMLDDTQRLCNEIFLPQYVTESTHRVSNTFDSVFSKNDTLLHSYSAV